MNCEAHAAPHAAYAACALRLTGAACALCPPLPPPKPLPKLLPKPPPRSLPRSNTWLGSLLRTPLARRITYEVQATATRLLTSTRSCTQQKTKEQVRRGGQASREGPASGLAPRSVHSNALRRAGAGVGARVASPRSSAHAQARQLGSPPPAHLQGHDALVDELDQRPHAPPPPLHPGKLGRRLGAGRGPAAAVCDERHEEYHQAVCSNRGSKRGGSTKAGGLVPFPHAGQRRWGGGGTPRLCCSLTVQRRVHNLVQQHPPAEPQARIHGAAVGARGGAGRCQQRLPQVVGGACAVG